MVRLIDRDDGLSTSLKLDSFKMILCFLTHLNLEQLDNQFSLFVTYLPRKVLWISAMTIHIT